MHYCINIVINNNKIIIIKANKITKLYYVVYTYKL